MGGHAGRMWVDRSYQHVLVVCKGLGCVPKFWAFLCKITCGFVQKVTKGVPN